jgi:hypothetical protein
MKIQASINGRQIIGEGFVKVESKVKYFIPCVIVVIDTGKDAVVTLRYNYETEKLKISIRKSNNTYAFEDYGRIRAYFENDTGVVASEIDTDDMPEFFHDEIENISEISKQTITQGEEL